MAVLVTGGAGYIGSHMVWALVDRGEEVVVLDNLSSGYRWAVAPAAIFYEGDVADEMLVADIILAHDIDVIVHFAGSKVVPESVADPLAYYDNNTGRTRALLTTAVRAGVPHFVFSSTAAVYGTVEAGHLVRETDPLTPQSPYGCSKLMSELILRDCAYAYGLNFVALRYFNVAGADPLGRTGQSSPDFPHLIKAACQAALGILPHVSVFGTDYPTHDGTGVRDYIHVADLVDAHLKAIDHLRDGGASLVANCGYGEGYSVLDVLNAVMRVNGRRFDIRYEGRREGDPAALVADPTVARERLGWEPRYDNLEEIVESALRWERALTRRSTYARETARSLARLHPA
ncbi:UDP-glucose 4-epimerase GalE [Rhizobium sp. SG2393]|uniref:UDP-glucose 4-epimerase GalE n=1 Tax=Rhizobium sp. SG2393 TaxID=3276279 RepID=UPI00366AC3AE